MEQNPDRALEGRTQTICQLILAAIAIGVTLSFLSSVLIPFVLAIALLARKLADNVAAVANEATQQRDRHEVLSFLRLEDDLGQSDAGEVLPRFVIDHLHVLT